MPASALALLMCCLAQDPVPGAPPPQPPAKAPIPPALQRASDDALAACKNLLATDHAFHGSVVRQDVGRAESEPASFRGAMQGTVQLFVVDKHRILTAGKKRLERVGDAAWTLPQGDAPDCPLAPSVLARHLPAATIDAWSASSHDDRPALRVHAVWKEMAAAALIGELAMPDWGGDALLEALARAAKKPRVELTTVDASLLFDPATKSLQGATLRVALLQPEDERAWPALLAKPRETDEPVPCPGELPPLAKKLWLQVVFVVSVLPAAKEPMPALDDTMRERLGLPAK